ncbi:phosphopyruvate hydratase [Candidatus Woesearchaeota archaeon]|nr:phosphopyruvate hydratase [Candidatus Woesearchaeota archaeon]
MTSFKTTKTNSFKITKIHAREILDSRGNPTVEAEVYTASGMAYGRVPSGASTGIHEALEMRDGDKKRYLGKGVLKAVNNVNTLIAKKLKGMDLRSPKLIDQAMIELDGTVNKSKLGANAILSASLGCANLLAKLENKPLYSILGNGKKSEILLPIPFLNVINGGKHAANKIAFQEFMIAPFGKNFRESLRMGAEAYHQLKKEISEKYGKESTNVGDEGGFAPKIEHVEHALNLLVKTIDSLGYKKQIKIAIDAAASEFYHHGYYHVDGRKFGSGRMIDFYEHLVKNYPIISLEDPFEQDHFLPWKELRERIGKDKSWACGGKGIQIVGDDLLCTNPNRIKMALDRNMCNALLLKVNQIGTLSEAINAAKLAMKNNWSVMVSHRSGETEDSFIADLAVALGCGQIKSGAPCRSERLAKYNQLMRIEEELGNKARYAGNVMRC